jgi:hypothetical protein
VVVALYVMLTSVELNLTVAPFAATTTALMVSIVCEVVC